MPLKRTPVQTRSKKESERESDQAEARDPADQPGTSSEIQRPNPANQPQPADTSVTTGQSASPNPAETPLPSSVDLVVGVGSVA